MATATLSIMLKPIQLMDRLPSNTIKVYFPHSTTPVGNYRLVNLDTNEVIMEVQATTLMSALSKLRLRLSPDITYTAKFMYTGLATNIWDI